MAIILCLISGDWSTAVALDVVHVQWGFDGRASRQKFNVVSVLLDNPEAAPFDGHLRLRKRLSGGAPIDAPLNEQVYVGPFARRWVQFYPYLGDGWETFGLQVVHADGTRAPEIELPSPQLGWPARVILSPDQAAAGQFPLKSLPESLFPPFVTATDGLQAVLLDSAPNWDEPRRRSFLNWIYRGGVAYVLQTPSGNYPEFPASLEILSGPLDARDYGAGRVIRVARGRREISSETLDTLFQSLPKRTRQNSDGERVDVTTAEESQDFSAGQPQYTDGGDPLNASSFLLRLKRMTRPNHNWPLLHLLFWAYIALIFPGCWLLGRVWSDYRLVYGALLTTVVLFSVLFGIVGQRGYGEATAVNSVAILRPLPEGQMDVAQWSNAFVISGGEYDIQHRGIGTLYSTCNVAEEVNGVITSGTNARFRVDIPPFSSREFAMRTQITLTSPQWAATEITPEADGLRDLRLSMQGPPPGEMASMYLLYGNTFYEMVRFGDGLRLGQRLGTAEGFLRVQEFDSWNYQYGPGWRDTEVSNEDIYRQMFIPLICRSLNVSSQSDAQQLVLPAEKARLFYFTELPTELAVDNPYLGKQGGYALHVVDISLESAPGT